MSGMGGDGTLPSVVWPTCLVVFFFLNFTWCVRAAGCVATSWGHFWCLRRACSAFLAWCIHLHYDVAVA